MIPVHLVDSHEDLIETGMLTIWDTQHGSVSTAKGPMPYMRWCHKDAERLKEMYPKICVAVGNDGRCCIYNMAIEG